jgi:hypothetical protein
MKSFIIFPTICLLFWVLAILTISNLPRQTKYKLILSVLLTCVLSTCVLLFGQLDNLVDYITKPNNVLLVIFTTLFPLTYVVNSYFKKSLGAILLLRLGLIALVGFVVLKCIYFVTIIITMVSNPEHLP